MLVRDCMTSPAITIKPDAPFQEALELMRQHHFRRLPVVDYQDALVGIVSERDLLHAAPSPASSLSMWELNYLLWKLQIKTLMTEKVVTVTPQTPIESAARIMVERKIGGLPVVNDDGHVVGVITETDIFRAFTELMAAGVESARIVMRVPNRKGVLAEVAQRIADLNGNIVSVGTYHGKHDNGKEALLLVKVTGVELRTLQDAISALGDVVVDARTV
jgi:acetoin utilization protein AcuB